MLTVVVSVVFFFGFGGGEFIPVERDNEIAPRTSASEPRHSNSWLLELGARLVLPSRVFDCKAQDCELDPR